MQLKHSFPHIMASRRLTHRSLRTRHLAAHLGRRLVFAQAFIDDLSKFSGVSEAGRIFPVPSHCRCRHSIRPDDALPGRVRGRLRGRACAPRPRPTGRSKGSRVRVRRRPPVAHTNRRNFPHPRRAARNFPIPAGSLDGDGSSCRHTCRSLHPSGTAQLGAGRVKTRLQCVIGLRKFQMPWKGCAAIGLQALIAAIKGPTPRMAMTRLRL